MATLAGCRLVPFDSLRPAQPGELRVDTVGRFKGMESHAVVLADLDRLGSERERRAAYVGMSRAKYALYLLAGPEAADQLRDALG
jgi:superfamily I DNA/RNA helicase